MEDVGRHRTHSDIRCVSPTHNTMLKIGVRLTTANKFVP
jgi:hypothetical protein